MHIKAKMWEALKLRFICGSSAMRFEKGQIVSDCRQFLRKVAILLSVPNAMLDLASVGPGEVLLVDNWADTE